MTISTSLARPGAAKSSQVSYQRRINRVGFLFALPALAHLGYFSLYPVLRSVYLSFTSWDLSGTPQFIGLENYVHMTSDPDLGRSIQVTLGYSVLLTVSLFVISLTIALLFDRRFPLRDLFRTIYFIPVVIPWVVTALVWILIYNPTYGLANIFTDALHLQAINWIQNIQLVAIALVIMSVWKGFGYYMVIFLAGLQNIPAEYYEAAQVDGANRLNTLRHITLPLLRPAMLLVAVTAMADSFQVFTPIWLMTKGGPAGATRMLTIYLFQNAFNFFKMGYATAIATLMLVTLVIVTRLQIRFWSTDY